MDAWRATSRSTTGKGGDMLMATSKDNTDFQLPGHLAVSVFFFGFS